jgi:hypothetical protein
MSETTLSAEVEAALQAVQEVSMWFSAACLPAGVTMDVLDGRLAEWHDGYATLRTALERSARIEAERDAARDAIRWALGESGSDFGDEPHVGKYWWRSHLRAKAGLVWSARRRRSVAHNELLDRAALNDREDG